MPEHFPRAMSSLGTVALTLSLATAALSEPTGDGRSGPATITGAAIDQALVALNGFFQARYQRKIVWPGWLPRPRRIL